MCPLRATGQPFNFSTWSPSGPLSLCASVPLVVGHRVPVSPCPRAPSQRLSSLRSDQPRLFGNGIELVLQEVEFDLQVRDLPRQLGVLGDELLEEGKDLFVGSVIIHDGDAWLRAKQSFRRRHAGEGKARIYPGREGERADGRFL